MADPHTRALLREILRLLLAERPDAGLLYVPRGEAGQRRMIDALLSMRPPQAKNEALDALLSELQR